MKLVFFRGFTLLLTLALLLGTASLAAAPSSDLWAKWKKNDPRNTNHINHGIWNAFLSNYLLEEHPSKVNRVRYSEVSSKAHSDLKQYLKDLEAVPISSYSREEQKAYWINFYNALTLNLILDHYPLESIKDISFGFFSFGGPWDEKLVQVEGESLSLNDIEHRILRPIWNDARIHYAVNCASVGCPNLMPQSFTAENTEALLEQAAKDYINHPRGAAWDGNTLVVSKIYDWYQVDFKNSPEGVVEHLKRYAKEPLLQQLKHWNGRIDYSYDWSLNEP